MSLSPPPLSVTMGLVFRELSVISACLWATVMNCSVNCSSRTDCRPSEELHKPRKPLVQPQLRPPRSCDDVPKPLVSQLVGHHKGHPLQLRDGVHSRVPQDGVVAVGDQTPVLRQQHSGQQTPSAMESAVQCNRGGEK